MWQIYGELLSLLVPLAVCLSVGYFWSRNGTFQLKFCSTLVLKISTPSLIFYTLSTAELDNDILLQMALVTLIALLVCAAVAALSLAILKLSVKDMLPAVVFPNTGNFGLPISYLALGEKSFAAAVVFFTCCAIIQHTVNSLFLNRDGSWLRILMLPPLLAVVIATILRAADIIVPKPILESTRLLGNLTVPIMLFVLGHALANIPRNKLGNGAVLAGLRMIIGPLSGIAVAKVMQLPYDFAMVIVLQMSMPVAVISYVYSTPRGAVTSDSIAGAVFISTLVAIATTPLMIWWLQT